ncbi:hypothetical protein [Kitasatospora sp. P5_F3]
MTWMPDREAVTRRRRRTSSSQQQYPEPQAQPHEYETHGRIGRQREAEAHPMGIPRILGRRARWVGARLRREE